MAKLKAFVRYDVNDRIVPGSLILREKKPTGIGTWVEITYNECCNPIPITLDNNKKLRAFVRYDNKHNIVASSLILAEHKPKVGNWTEINAYNCCRNNNPIVNICGKNWMLKDLDVTTYRNGDPIPEVIDNLTWQNLTTGAWCWSNNDPSTGLKIYNWYAVNDPRGLAPQGWHIPTNTEWDDLITCLGGENIAGGKLKEAGTTHWESPNTGATNSSGFTALPGNWRSSGGYWSSPNLTGTFWTSTEAGPFTAKFKKLEYNTTSMSSYNTYKYYGSSVRCIKD